MAIAAPAHAATVGPGANGKHAELLTGGSLTIDLKPGDSGSTGSHWAFARQPSSKLLALRSHRASSDGKHETFVYRAKAAGFTSLTLQYRPPGRKARPKKTFRLTVIVNDPEQQLDCDGIPSHAQFTLIARSGTADAFRTRRTIFLWQVDRAIAIPYDAYYGCAFNTQHAYPLGGLLDRTKGHEFSNIALSGSTVGYVDDETCSIDPQEGCLGSDRFVGSQDLSTGSVIRSVPVIRGQAAENDPVTGFVLSPSGGLAWIEKYQTPEGGTIYMVRRSDAAPTPGQPVTTGESIDDGQSGLVDPDSLAFDGSDVFWTRDGHRQHAPLR